MALDRILGTPTRTLRGEDALSRAKELGAGLWKAIKDTPRRLKSVYTQPQAHGIPGMKGLEETAGAAARGVRQVKDALDQASR